MGLACFRWMGTDYGSKLKETGTANSTVADTMPRHGRSVPKTPLCPQTKPVRAWSAIRKLSRKRSYGSLAGLVTGSRLVASDYRSLLARLSVLIRRTNRYRSHIRSIELFLKTGIKQESAYE